MRKTMRFILAFLCAFSVAALLAQTRQEIQLGASANDGTGDSLRGAFIKVSNNESNLFKLVLTNSSILDASFVVEDVAALVALDPANKANVRTLGYYTAGDGGGATYRWQASYAGTTNEYGGAFSVSGGAWVQVLDGRLRGSTFGIVGDGSTDNTSRLEALMEFSSLALQVAVLDVGGTVIAHQATANGLSLLAIEQIAGTLKSPDGVTGEVLWITNCPGVKVSGLSVDGNFSNQVGGSSSGGFGGSSGTASVALVDCDDARIDKCVFQNFAYRGVKVLSSDNVSVTRCTIKSGNGGGVILAYCDGAVVDGCLFRDMGLADADTWYLYHCLDIQSAARPRVSNNTFSNSAQAAFQCTQATDPQFLNNTLSVIGWNAFKLDGGSGSALVSGNSFYDMGSYGLFFGGSFGDFNGTIAVSGNVFSGFSTNNVLGRTVFVGGSYLLGFRHPPSGAIFANNKWDMGGNGAVGLLFNSPITFSGNAVYNATAGLLVNTGGTVTSSVFTGNTFSNVTSDVAISLKRSSGGDFNNGNTISDNLFWNAGLSATAGKGSAIYLGGSTSGNRINGNTFIGGAAGFPVYVEAATRSQFTDNVCVSNNWKNAASFGRFGDKSVVENNRHRVSLEVNWGTVPDGTVATNTVSIPGSLVSYGAVAVTTNTLPSGVSLSAQVSAADAVEVLLTNSSGSPQAIGTNYIVAHVSEGQNPNLPQGAVVGPVTAVENSADLSIYSGGTNSSASLYLGGNSGTALWRLFTDGSMTGSNAGADLVLRALNDSGGTIGSVATFDRSSLSSTFAGPVTITGSGMNTPLYIGNGSANTIVEVNGAASALKEFRLQTAGTLRWRFGSTSTAESGANAGSDFQIVAMTDGGSTLSFPMVIKRSTGRTTLTSLTVSGQASIEPTASTLTESGGNVTITGGGRAKYSHVLNAATGGDANLVFSGLVDGDTGTLYVHPAATNVTITLSDAFAFSPTGSTITINGGTGSTNHTIIAWENKVISSTNRVSVNASNYYR